MSQGFVVLRDITPSSILSGINICYYSTTPEGWYIIYVDNPNDHFVEWMIDFPADCWIEDFPFCQSFDFRGIKNNHTILIKDTEKFLYFKLRWWTPEECGARPDATDYSFQKVIDWFEPKISKHISG